MEKSWHTSLYKDCNIVPEAEDQRPFPTCVFCSFTKGGQMEMHRIFADEGIPCDICLFPKSMVEDYLTMNGINMSSFCQNKDFLHRSLTASLIFEAYGVEATSYLWEGTTRLAMEACPYLGDSITFDQLKELLNKGKPVLAMMIVGPDFEKLRDKEIYKCHPVFLSGKLQKPFEYHRVILIGHGVTEVTKENFVPFLNSHSDKFGHKGVGRAYFNDLMWFFTLEGKYPPLLQYQPPKIIPLDRPNLDKPRRRPACDNRRNLDKPWRRSECDIGTVEQTEASGRADAASSWRLDMPQQIAKVNNGTAWNGTTCLHVLTKEIVDQGCKLMASGMIGIDLRDGICMAVDDVVRNLMSMARKINTFEEIAQVGTVSANGEKELGDLIAEAIAMVGTEGVITIADGSTRCTELQVLECIKLKRGYFTKHFITNHKNKTCELDDPLIFIHDKRVSNVQAIKVLEFALMEGKPLFILAEDVDTEAINTMINEKYYKGMKVCAVKVPGHGENKELNLLAICLLTGGLIFTEGNGMDLWPHILGTSKKVIVSADDCTIFGGAADDNTIGNRTKQLRSATEKSTGLAEMYCCATIMKIGGMDKMEIIEKKDRAAHALNATKAAVEEGIVPGGGVALVYAAKDLDKLETANVGQKSGVQIIQNVLKIPFHTNASSACRDGEDIVSMILEQNNTGLVYDAAKGEYADMLEAGSVEPLKVIITALMDVQRESCQMLTDTGGHLSPKERNKQFAVP
ncbi:chaperonin CPN60-1, mitochondrial-like [Hordeum vulgare subsp. vulgare]|uniref:Uncharacterized protein n=1 Tax=Hordeum vulgare subsp. vulgare TaxID=112509 RepID=A0A8I7B7J8_HORVV|nr:chaperonin CPN60-1, mitochondrial-like [Hordeum vulgare subsp. vulgare]